jgi:hypothetical protein
MIFLCLSRLVKEFHLVKALNSLSSYSSLDAQILIQYGTLNMNHTDLILKIWSHLRCMEDSYHRPIASN